MAVFARTVNRTHDDVGRVVVESVILRCGEIHFHDGIACVGQIAELVAVAGLTTRGAVHITAQGRHRHCADVAARDVDPSRTRIGANIDIIQIDRPAEGVARVVLGNGIGVAYRSHGTAAIHVTADVAALDVDFGRALHVTCSRIV